MKSDVAYKIVLFAIFLIGGTLLSGGNVFIGIIAGLIIVSVKESNDAYNRGKREGYEECQRSYKQDK